MQFNKNFNQKKEIEGKYIIGIDPGDYNHRAVVLNTFGQVIGKPFSFAVNYDGFNVKFLNYAKSIIPEFSFDKVVVAIESSINFYQTFTAFALNKGMQVVHVSPLKTYLARGYYDNDFSKSDSKDAMLVAETAFNGKYVKAEIYSDEFNSLHALSIQYDKLLKDKCEYRMKLRAFMHQIFPEYLKAFDIETQTSLYLLRKYFLPEDFQKINIEKEAEIISKISVKQHGSKTLESLKQISLKTIGLPTSDYVKTYMRSILDSHLDALELTKKHINAIMKQMIALASESPYFAILISIKGISKILAAQFIAECPHIENFKHYSQLQKYLGFSLRAYQSGNFAGVRHINKLGNKRLARVFFQMLEQTSRYVPEIRFKYLTRKIKCRNYKKNIISISDNLSKLIIKLFNNNELYQENTDEILKTKIKELEKKHNKKNKLA